MFLPSPNFNALFLLKHMMSHFAAQGITLRQVLDCGLYASKYNEFIDMGLLSECAEKVGMLGYLDVIVFICTHYLGFDKGLFAHEFSTDSEALHRAVADILEPEFNEEHPSNIFSEIWYKLRRWRSNMWKHRLVYKTENLAGTFLTQTWSHLLKPSSIAFGMK